MQAEGILWTISSILRNNGYIYQKWDRPGFIVNGIDFGFCPD